MHTLKPLTFPMFCSSTRSQVAKSGHFNPAYSGGSASSGLDNYYKPHGSTGYHRQMMPPEPDPDYEAVGSGSGRPGDKPRKVLLIVFIFGSAVATALLVSLVALAPTEKALRTVGLLQ